MNDERRLAVTGASGTLPAILTITNQGDTRRITVRLDDARLFLGDGVTTWDALLDVRRALEAEGLLICCQGARPNVWPSGMALQMSDGLKAYVQPVDREPTSGDLVDVLAPADASTVGTIADQEKQRDLQFRAQAAGAHPDAVAIADRASPPVTSGSAERHGVAKWSRAVAIIATPAAILLVGLRYRALSAAAITPADQGYIFGRLIVSPLILGSLIWLGIFAIARRKDPSLRLVSAGLLATVSVVAIITAFGSVRA